MRITIDSISHQTIERAELLLAGLPGAADKAIRSAISRTAQKVRSQSSKRIREKYAISDANLRLNTNIRIGYSYSSGNGMRAHVDFRGAKIPLHRYNGSSPSEPTFSNMVTVPVHTSAGWFKVHPGVAASGHQFKGTAPTQYRNAFVAKFRSGHVGIFERTGGVTSSGNDEIRELMGSAVPQMLGNEEVLNALANDAGTEFDKRMTHEVDAFLNGWR